jgi:Nickel responsive protein SCO4226-like
MPIGRNTSERTNRSTDMPRYIVQRTFPEPLEIPITPQGAEATGQIAQRNLDHDVTWLHSYVSADRRSTFCLYEAPTPEAIRQAADSNGLPVDGMTEVRVLDPYFYVAG